MKQKRKHILKKILIFGIAVMLASCSEELFDEAIESSNKASIKEVRFNELYQDSKFKNLIEKVSHTSNAARTSFENQNGFTISDGFVKVIETDSVISYTMLIERDIVTDTISFENLVIHENKFNASQKAYSIKYTPTIFKPSGHDSFYYEGTEVLKNLAFTGFNRAGENAIESSNCNVYIIQVWCSQPFRGSTGHHIATSICSPSTQYYKFVSIISPDDCDGSSSSGSSGSNNTNAPQGPTGPGNSGGITSPVNPNQSFGQIQDMDTPCKQLSAMSSTIKSNVKAKLNELAPYTNQKDKEYGFNIELIFKADGTKEFITDDIRYLGTMGGALDTGPTIIGSGHNHPINGHSMFSFTDVCNIKDIYNKAKPSKQGFVFIYIVVKDNETGAIFPYALKIDDFNALTTKVNDELAKPELASLTYAKKLEALDDALGFKYDDNPTDLEKVFLEEYKLFGISLYKSDNLELNNWKKLELKTDGTVGQVPCNN